MSGLIVSLSVCAPSRLVETGRNAIAVLATWLRRARERRELLQLTELELRDFGVGRTDALAEAAKPFWRA